MLPIALSIGDPITAISVAVAMIVLNLGTDLLGAKVYEVSVDNTIEKTYRKIGPSFCPSYCATNHFHLAHKINKCKNKSCNHWVIC